MTEITSNHETAKAPPTPAAPPPPAKGTPPNAPPSVPPRPVKSGRGLAAFSLLIALGAVGASGYLWYLWQQERAAQTSRLDTAVKQALGQVNPQLQSLKTQLQEIQGLKSAVDQARTENQDIKGQALGLAGDLQPLKNAMELQKGENEILKGEMKLLRENHDLQKTEIAKRTQAVDTQLQGYRTHLDQLDEQIKNMRLTDTGLAENLDTLRTLATKGGDINAFPLAEVDYLLRLANSKLKLERNVPAAQLALETAQQRLKAVNEPILAPINTMLDEVIGSLRGVKLPDLSALAHKVVEMGSQVPGLPIKIDSGTPNVKEQLKPATDVTISEDSALPWWDRASAAVWNQFKDIVVIRRVRSEAPPLIAMEEEFFLRQNLLLGLESMRAALLRADAGSYQDSSALVEKWVTTYFDQQNAKVTDFLTELKVLQEVQFNPYIPDVTGLQQAFNDVLKQRQPVRSLSQPIPAPSEPVSEPPLTDRRGGRP